MIALRFDDLPLPVRTTDPATSHKAARAVVIRAGSQRARLLVAYADAGDYGLTNDGACGELLAGGFIRATEDTRPSRAGEAQRVCVITRAGLDALDNMGRK
jgi:non-ribosomal peptide synthetase component E (peptide arylation enzyme)